MGDTVYVFIVIIIIWLIEAVISSRKRKMAMRNRTMLDKNIIDSEKVILDFPLGRYPTNTIIEVFRKADKSKRELTLEHEDPWFSIDLYGFDRVEDDFLLDVVSHLEEFDNMVQCFCEEIYHHHRERNINNYVVYLAWVEIESNEITLGYWGKTCMELRAIFINKNGNWEAVDIYYQ